jgi:hypothetical protein
LWRETAAKEVWVDNEYISLTEATRMSGISRPTLRRIIGRGALEDFQSEADRRVRLVRLADLKSLMTPVPRQVPSEGSTRQGAAAA